MTCSTLSLGLSGLHSTSTIWETLSIFLSPYIIIYLAFYILKKNSNKRVLFAMLYLSQAFVVIMPLALFGLALGGTSMASVEGGATTRDIASSVVEGIFLFFLFFQIFLIPWTFFVHKKLLSLYPINKNLVL